jgi:phosphopantothenoylcysteine decarboxylase
MLSLIHDLHDPRRESAVRQSASALVEAQNDGKIHLLLACSGSVATIKLPQMIDALAKHANLSIRIILTASAAHFLHGQSAEQPSLSALAKMPHVDAVYQDADEWGPRPWRRGIPILHIELRRWADLLVVAPLSVNTMAMITGGMCSTLLTSVVRAWDATGEIDGRKKRIVVAPAANTAMWKHPLTEKQLRVLEEEWGGDEGWFDVLRPQEKTLACGDTGMGAMRDWKEIVDFIEVRLGLNR